MTILSISISAATCLAMICAVLFFPKIRLGKFSVASYWLITLIGALAGIMWSSILKTHGLKFGYTDFLKIGVTVALPALLVALGTLSLVL